MAIGNEKVIDLFKLANKIHNYAITCIETDNEELTDKLHSRVVGIDEILDKIVIQVCSEELGMDLQPYMTELTGMLEKYVADFKDKIDDTGSEGTV